MINVLNVTSAVVHGSLTLVLNPPYCQMSKNGQCGEVIVVKLIFLIVVRDFAVT